ncbi:MAG TPA: class I SAM-dependent methyltransferase [Vicinamibacterales bacterium]|nr:class I SAM-dependent methyltransferase [Vicinamibacterales bacterium]
MNACCSSFGETAGRQFDRRRAVQELNRYRRRGPDSTTKLLSEALVNVGLGTALLLDVGTGIGALTFEMLDSGCAGAIAVDASPSYLSVAAAEATRLGRTAHIRFVHGDFVDLAPTLPSASVVALDRVVCCYPRFRPLLEHALARAERALALSYPLDAWYVRTLGCAKNLKRRLGGSSFRTFVHSAADMEQIIRNAGFTLSSRQRTWLWSADVYVRRVHSD